jgi:hypothetical protein
VYTTTDGPGSPVDALLEDAQVLVPGEEEGRGPTAAERIACAARARRDARGVPERAGAGRAHPAPARFPSEHEQARHELDLTSALVISTALAAAHLDDLIDDRHAGPEGALVFACLLHLSGHEEAGRFWWQFAAGGGSHTAAYCLHLYHGSHAEFRDADYWRRQAVRLRAQAPARPDAGRAPGVRPLLSAEIRRDILAQCHRGARPHLPLAVEAVINQLPVDGDDADFGEIPRPTPHLTAALSARG